MVRLWGGFFLTFLSLLCTVVALSLRESGWAIWNAFFTLYWCWFTYHEIKRIEAREQED